MPETADPCSSHAKRHLKVGLCGIGLQAYWSQFEGLEEKLRGYVGVVDEHLTRPGVEVVNLGLIDTPEGAMEAGHRFRENDVDVLFLHVTTYAVSSTVLPIVRRLGVPVIVLNLQPTAAIDYHAFNALGDRTRMTGEWLAYCSACPVPEIANVLLRAGIPFEQVTGTLEPGDTRTREALDAWVDAARVRFVMEHNRLGLVGHVYNGMLDIHTDLTAQLAAFGGHIELIEPDEVTSLREGITGGAVAERVEHFREAFDLDPGCDDTELSRAARTSLALDALVENRDLGSLAYFFHSVPGHANEDLATSVILGCSLLTARGVPVAGEYEVKNAQAMKILDALGAGGSFTEYYALDLGDDIVLMGHDGPGHTRIAEGRARVKPLEVYHGKVGRGLSIEMSVRHGPVTLLSVIEGEAGPELLVAEAESVPGPILEIGNTNSRYRFPVGARAFVEAWNAAGPAHHCAIGVGHRADALEKLAWLLRMPLTRVC